MDSGDQAWALARADLAALYHGNSSPVLGFTEAHSTVLIARFSAAIKSPLTMCQCSADLAHCLASIIILFISILYSSSGLCRSNPCCASSDNYGAHCLCVEMNDVTVWFSYKTPIAFQVGCNPRVVRQNDWKTTGKHLNAIDGGDKKSRVDDETFERLWNEQVVCRNETAAA